MSVPYVTGIDLQSSVIINAGESFTFPPSFMTASVVPLSDVSSFVVTNSKGGILPSMNYQLNFPLGTNAGYNSHIITCSVGSVQCIYFS